MFGLNQTPIIECWNEMRLGVFSVFYSWNKLILNMIGVRTKNQSLNDSFFREKEFVPTFVSWKYADADNLT